MISRRPNFDFPSSRSRNTYGTSTERVYLARAMISNPILKPMGLSFTPSIADRRSAKNPDVESPRKAFRVSILARENGQQPMLIHRIVNDYDASNGTFLYTAPITAPANPLELVVAVEELSTGVWGGARTQVK